MTIQYSYIIDRKNPHRRMTIARSVSDGLINYNFAINKCVDHSSYSYDSKESVVVHAHPIDVFTKKRGREIALGRMKSMGEDGFFVEQDPNEAPHITVIKDIAQLYERFEGSDSFKLSSRLCQDFLDQWTEYHKMVETFNSKRKLDSSC